MLINGASGGVGTYAVQLAKWLGADVYAVCSTGNVRRPGHSRTAPWTRPTDFTRSGIVTTCCSTSPAPAPSEPSGAS